MASKITVKLDTSRRIYNEKECKQNDDLILEAYILENGAKKDLTNATITINGVKSNKKFVIQTTEITKVENKITAELGRAFTRVAGEAKIEITLVETEKQNTTFEFILNVRASVIDGAVEDDNLITEFEKLNAKVTEGATLNSNLEQKINAGTPLDTSLGEKITNGTALGSQLDEKNAAATQNKTALEGVIGTATQTNATLTETNRVLGETNTVATQKKGELDTSIGSATQINGTLGQTNAAATETNNLLTQNNTAATQNNTALGEANNLATQKKSDLDGAINSANQTKEALEQINTTAGATNTTLTATNNTAINTDTALKGSIATAEQRKNELDQSITNSQGGIELMTYDGNGVDISDERVRIFYGSDFKLPVTQSDSVFLSDGTSTLTSWINSTEETINNKVNDVQGKQLSTEDYTTEEKNKLSGIAEGANNYTHPPTHSANEITEEVNKRFLTDDERNIINAINTLINNGGRINGPLELAADLITGRLRGVNENIYLGNSDKKTRIDVVNGHIRLFVSEVGQNDTGLQILQDGTINIRVNNATVHQFRPDGTKTGGSIEVKKTRYGMAPTDSFQMLIEYVEYDINIEGEKVIELHPIYKEIVSKYAVFPSNSDIKVIEKTKDYFKVKGIGITDFNIKGQRIGGHEDFLIMNDIS